MARTETNFTGFIFAPEDTDGSLPGSPFWRDAEVNSDAISGGATITTVARNPISPDNQARKGVITNRASTFGFTTDLTIQAVQDFVPVFTFSRSPNTDLIWDTHSQGTRLNVSSTSSYMVGSLSSTQQGKLHYSSGGNKTLLFARGFTQPQNNGLKVLASAPSGQTLSVGTGNLAVEPTQPENASLEIAGIRGGSGDLSCVTRSDGTATLDTSDLTADVDDWGLVPGQWIHLGGISDDNCFQDTSDVVVRGFARIRSIDTSAGIILDKLSPTIPRGQTLRASSAEVDILFGRYWTYYERGHDLFNRPSLRFETAHPNLGDGTIGNAGDTLYRYSIGNVGNQLTINITPEQLITASLAFVGRDTRSPVIPSERADGADDSFAPLANSGMNATSDVAIIRISTRETDDAFESDFTQLSLTLNNNINTENVIGRLGARYVNTGRRAVTATVQGILQTASIEEASHSNRTMTMDIALQNEEGGVVIDIPSLTLTVGPPTYTEDQSVRQDATITAFRDARFGTSVSFSHFPILPALPEQEIT